MFIDRIFSSKSRLRKAHKALSKIQSVEALRRICHIYADAVYEREGIIDELSGMLNELGQKYLKDSMDKIPPEKIQEKKPVENKKPNISQPKPKTEKPETKEVIDETTEMAFVSCKIGPTGKLSIVTNRKDLFDKMGFPNLTVFKRF